jgi:hypothetical protein
MTDNFDLKGYLRHGNKLLNEGIGGYKDIKLMKEMDLDSFVGAQRDTANFQSQFIEDIETVIAHIKDGYGTIGSDYVQQAWEAFSDIPFDTVEDEVFAELMANGVVQDTKGEYPDINEMEPEGDQYDDLDDDEHGPAIVNELEKPENIYDDEEELSINYNGSDSDRMMDLGGDVIEQNIISLLDDGFDPEDVLEFCKYIIDAHSQPKAIPSIKF